MTRLYANCEQLPMFNFDKIRKGGGYEWLVYGYDGWGEVDVPKEVEGVWFGIINEYANLTKNNRSLQYFELLADISDMSTRITIASSLLYQIAIRWERMSSVMQKQYNDQLKEWRFYLNINKGLDHELERMRAQIKAIQMKLKIKETEKKDFEKGNGKEMDTITMKVKIQRIIKMPINLKETAVKEWVAIIEDAINN